MMKVELIGHLGADAEVQTVDGFSFATCRVADSNRWTDKDGVAHDVTRWIDVNIVKYDKLLPYLKKGTLVFVRGNLDTRVYSSEKDRCYKCGITIRSLEFQLLSANKREETDSQTTEGQEYEGF